MINLDKLVDGKEKRFLVDVSDSINGVWGSLDHMQNASNVQINCLGKCISVQANVNTGIYTLPIPVANAKIQFYNGTVSSMLDVIDSSFQVLESGTISGILRLKRSV